MHYSCIIQDKMFSTWDRNRCSCSGKVLNYSRLQHCQFGISVSINLLTVSLQLIFLNKKKSVSVTCCVVCEREQNPLSIPHWILLICPNHALIVRYRAASQHPQKTLQIDIWQLGGEEGGLGLSFTSLFFFTVNMWPNATHLEDLRELSSCDFGCSQQSQFHWSCGLCYKYRNEQRKGGVS